MANITKADLEARIGELESQLAASTSDPKEAGMTKLVGMLKGVRSITREGGRFTVCGILTNSTQVISREGGEIRVDLPVDGFIATDNGRSIASDISNVDATTEWARVAIYGYWTNFGEISRNDRGYPVAQRRQLRAMRIEVLSAKRKMIEPEDLSLPPIDHTNQDEFAPF